MNREESLKCRFNGFWNKKLGTSGQDYYSRMQIADLIDLKVAVSEINNIITLRTTFRFIEMLSKNGIISSDEAAEMFKSVDTRSANANGFDVEYESDRIKIVAEVKCNIPVNKDSFGAAQISGIAKDIAGLMGGKRKSEKKVADFLKFFVMLRSSDAVEPAMQKLTDKNQDVVKFIPGMPLDNGHVYVVYVNI